MALAHGTRFGPYEIAAQIGIELFLGQPVSPSQSYS